MVHSQALWAVHIYQNETWVPPAISRRWLLVMPLFAFRIKKKKRKKEIGFHWHSLFWTSLMDKIYQICCNPSAPYVKSESIYLWINPSFSNKLLSISLFQLKQFKLFDQLKQWYINPLIDLIYLSILFNKSYYPDKEPIRLHKSAS